MKVIIYIFFNLALEILLHEFSFGVIVFTSLNLKITSKNIQWEILITILTGLTNSVGKILFDVSFLSIQLQLLSCRIPIRHLKRNEKSLLSNDLIKQRTKQVNESLNR